MTIVREAGYIVAPVTLDEDELDEEIEEQEMSGGLPSLIEIMIGSRLIDFVLINKLGWVFGPDADFEIEGLKSKGKRSKLKSGITSTSVKERSGKRQPDLAFVSIERLPAVPRGAIRVAPDLAVEVFSKTDSTYDMGDKVAEYFKVGVRMVWVVRPSEKLIEVRRANQDKPLVLGSQDELEGGEVLPGFRLKLSDIFGRVIEAADDEESEE